MIAGESVRSAWPWIDEAGAYFLPIKYGRHSIELKKGIILDLISMSSVP